MIKTQTTKGRDSPRDREQFFEMLRELTALEANQLIAQAQKRPDYETILRHSFSTIDRPDSFHSVPAVRKQLLAEFVYLHYPKDTRAFSPSKINLLDTPETAVFTSATDALFLAQIATSAGDRRLMQNAVTSYQRALRGLRNSLSRPRACFDDHIYATMHAMYLCETFAGIAVDDRASKAYTKGVASLLETRGPQTISSRYMKLQLQQHHQQVLWDGLVSRKRPTAGKGAWLSVEKPCPVRLPELTSLSLRVPGALEDADALCARGRWVDFDDITATLSELKKLDGHLQKWVTTWYFGFACSPYWKVQTNTLPWIRDFLPPDQMDVFPSALQFPTSNSAQAHAMLWMSLLALRQAVKDVVELHPFPLLARTGSEQTQMLLQDIRECADGLCMTAMFLCDPECGTNGYIAACGPLQLAAQWYERARDVEKLAWCRRMAESIEARGIRAPSCSNTHMSPQQEPATWTGRAAPPWSSMRAPIATATA